MLAYPEEQTCTVLLDESITDVTLSRRIIEGKLRLDGFVWQNTDEPNRLFTKDGSEWRYVITQEEDKVFFQVLREPVSLTSCSASARGNPGPSRQSISGTSLHPPDCGSPPGPRPCGPVGRW